MKLKHYYILLILFTISCTSNKESDSEKGKVDSAAISDKVDPLTIASKAKEDSLLTIERSLPLNTLTKKFFSAGRELIIPKDSTYILNDVSSNFSVFKMGDNARLVIGSRLDSCRISAYATFIGKNCEIVSTGNQGSPGGIGQSFGDDNGHGQDGVPGGTGAIGGQGGVGKYLEINIGLNELNSLRIISKGGTGGTGGSGGKGQRGGNAVRFIHSGGNGGAGGLGGVGGTGGRGGEIKVTYWFNEPAVVVEGRFSLNVDGGDPGAGGPGGPPGGGGNAVNSSPGRRHGGNPGPPGAAGASGPVGVNGPFPKQILVKRPV